MAQPAQPSREKRKRASKPKVKTGCITCKIRHVKCDETKPECVKCTSTGRKCDGYPAVVDKTKRKSSGAQSTSPELSSKSSFPSPERQLQVSLGTTKERRAIEFFFHRTAPQLSGFFSGSFWNGSVLQFSLSEPAIRYAMIAVSAMYEEENLIGYSPCAGTEAHQTFALQSYNKAIHSLISTAKSNPESIRIPVMVAIIFVCLEFLRGNVDAAITHIESGIKMLKGWRRRHGNPQTSPAVAELPAETAFIEHELVPMFGWLNMLSSLFGRPSLELYASSNDSGDSYAPGELATTVSKARIDLLDLVNTVVRFIQIIGDSKYKAEATMDMILEQMRLQSLMEEWGLNFDLLAQSYGPLPTDRDIRGANLLRAIHLTLTVWLGAALAPNETAWDIYRSDYEEIVRLSETSIANATSPPDEVQKRFSFELGLIPPLHFVAWKCRWPHIRRKALSLLWASPRRECLFESHRSYAVFARVMVVEEEYFGLKPGEVPGESDLPPEPYRVHQVDISPLPPTPAGNPMNFLLKPAGLNRPWHVRTEYIDVGNVEFEQSFSTYPWISADEPTSETKERAEKKTVQFNSEEHEPVVFTGLSVRNAQNILSVGRFKPNSKRDEFIRRKMIFS